MVLDVALNYKDCDSVHIASWTAYRKLDAACNMRTDRSKMMLTASRLKIVSDADKGRQHVRRQRLRWRRHPRMGKY